MSRGSRRRLARALVALAGVAALGTGCASIPASSSPQVFGPSTDETVPPRNPDPRYDAIQPQPGEAPIDIVRDYLAVGGSHDQQHAGARAYLTPKAAKSWNDAAGVVALEDGPLYLFPDKGGAEVVMSARQHGRVDSDGSYIPSTAPVPYRFHMEKIDGEWRIDNPPGGVLVLVSTFERAWRPYNVYFLDSTKSRVVPDVRLVPFPQDNVLPGVLVSDLGNGPSAALAGAVRSDLEGVRLQSNVVRESDRVRVYLTGLGDSADTLEAGGFAQIVWTLNQLGVGGIEIYLDGQPVSPRNAPSRTLQRFGDWRGYDPDGLAVSTPGYFIRDGAVLTTANTPVTGPAGSAAYEATSVGVSTDQRSMAVVGSAPGNSVGLYLGRTGGSLRRVLTGTSLSPPTWGAAVDEVWTVKDGREIILVPASGEASRVTSPMLDRLGPVWGLRLSRDGARVALVVGPPKGQHLYLGVVVREYGAVRIDGVRPADVGAGPVSDVSWSDALTVTVLVRAQKEDASLYTVDVDGRTSGRVVSTSGLPAPPFAVAAAPNLPLLAVAAGAVWSSPGSGEPWTRVTREPADDSAPAYPG